MNHIAQFLLGEMRLSAKKGHEDRTWRVTTVIDTTGNHTGHFDGVVRAWPPWLPFTLVDVMVALQAPQGQDPSPSASGSAGGWWPSADSISGNGLSWREPPGSPSLPPGICQDPLPSRSNSSAGSSCLQSGLWIRWGFCCTSVPVCLIYSCYSPVTTDPKRPPVNCPHTELHLSLFPGNCCSVAQSRLTLRPHGRQHTRPACPSPSPGVCPSSESIKSVMSSNHFISAVLFSFCLQSFPSPRFFPMSWLFTSGDQSTGVSASVLPVSIHYSISFLGDLPQNTGCLQNCFPEPGSYNLLETYFWPGINSRHEDAHLSVACDDSTVERHHKTTGVTQDCCKYPWVTPFLLSPILALFSPILSPFPSIHLSNSASCTCPARHKRWYLSFITSVWNSVWARDETDLTLDCDEDRHFSLIMKNIGSLGLLISINL